MRIAQPPACAHAWPAPDVTAEGGSPSRVRPGRTRPRPLEGQACTGPSLRGLHEKNTNNVPKSWFD